VGSSTVTESCNTQSCQAGVVVKGDCLKVNNIRVPADVGISFPGGTTHETCLEDCRVEGGFFGVDLPIRATVVSGSECFCYGDDRWRVANITLVDAGLCDMPCDGDARQICGSSSTELIMTYSGVISATSVSAATASVQVREGEPVGGVKNMRFRKAETGETIPSGKVVTRNGVDIQSSGADVPSGKSEGGLSSVAVAALVMGCIAFTLSVLVVVIVLTRR